MFASNCGSTCSAFNDIRHESDWYGNSLIPVDNSIRKVALVEESNRILNPLESQNHSFSMFGQPPIVDLPGSHSNMGSSIDMCEPHSEYWQRDHGIHDMGFSYMHGMVHNGDMYYLRGGGGVQEGNVVRSVCETEEFTAPSCCMNSQNTVTSPALSSPTPAVAATTTTTTATITVATTTSVTTHPSVKQCSINNAPSSGGSVEIQVEVDPNLYMNCETSVDGDSWSDSRGKILRGSEPCRQKEKSVPNSSSSEKDVVNVSNNDIVTLDSSPTKVDNQEQLTETPSCKETQNMITEDEDEEEGEEDEEQSSEEDEESCNSSSTESDENECDVETVDGKRMERTESEEGPPTAAKFRGCGESKEDIETQLSQFYKFECDKCVEKVISFSNHQMLVEHCRDKHETDGCVKCCGRLMSDRDELVKHMSEHKHTYRCGECRKVLPSKASWRSHLKQHGSAGPFQCPHCSKRFSSKYGLANHRNLHLPEGERPYKCKHCSKGFGAKHAMTKHERTHLPDEERLSYVCDICGKRFGYASTLDGHQRHVHQNERPFVCHVCAKTFPIKGALTYHLTTHEVQDRVQCTECGIWLKNEKILRIHKKCHQGELYSCPHCDKVSSTRNNLRMHMKRHSDARPHACPLCIRAFKTPRDLKTHMVQHTGQKPYSCPYCPKTFASPSNFYAHRKMKHKMAPAPFEGPHSSMQY